MHPSIPRQIIQTGKSASQSLRIRGMITGLRLLNPDFEYLFFDDDGVNRFIAQEFPQYRSVFESFPIRIQRFDFFRYLAVYRYGGFYFDLDLLFSEGIADLTQYSCVFPFEGFTFSPLLRKDHHIDWEIGNYGFGAAPGHPFLEAVIENCIRGQRDPAWVDQMLRGTPRFSRREFYVLYSTGPGVVTRTLAENPSLARTVRVLFPDNVCDSSKWNCFGDYAVHMMDSTWRPYLGRWRRRFAMEMEALTFRRLLKESQGLGPARRHLYTAGAETEPRPRIGSAIHHPASVEGETAITAVRSRA